MREVNGSSSTVTAQPGHRTMMALKHLSDARLTVTHVKTTVKGSANYLPSPQGFFSQFVRSRNRCLWC